MASPRVKMPYAYLMAWFVTHCKGLMFGRADADKEDIPSLCQFEGRQWKHQHIVEAWKAIDRYNAYKFFRFFNDTNAEDLGGLFCDVGSLLAGTFWWLQYINSSYLVCWSADVCELSSYFQSWFARQLGYSQLYVSNHWRALVHKGSLVDGVRAWLHFIMASTGATFRIPTRDPSLSMTSFL